MKELTILMATDAVSYGRYVRSILVMQAEAEAARVRITHATWEYERKLEKQRKEKGKKR